MTEFKEGELVNVTIERARVASWVPARGELTIVSDADAESDHTTFDLASDQITVERCDPEWWPPRSGDLLQHTDGKRWFGVNYGSEVTLISGYAVHLDRQEAWELRHSLTLVHREEQS